jgi:hypothetical protein
MSKPRKWQESLRLNEPKCGALKFAEKYKGYGSNINLPSSSTFR